MKRLLLLLSFLSLILGSCATYYKRTEKMNQAFMQGKLEEADKTLAKYKKGAEGKNRLLYFMNRGVINSMLGRYEESNRYLEQAYLTTQSISQGSRQATQYLTNPEALAYEGENHEKLYIYYYKALNYLKMNRPNEALVECKRMNIALNQLNDKYQSKNKFQKDAFVHLLMGVIYEMNNEHNDAFIAYRNAYNIYETDYKSLFNITSPKQLKEDLIRSAYRAGFSQEGREYEQKFNLRHEPRPSDQGEVVFLWHNGLVPVKGESSINFNVMPGQGGNVTFVNEEFGLSVPFQTTAQNNNASGF